MPPVRINAVRSKRCHLGHTPLFDRAFFAGSPDLRSHQNHAKMRTNRKRARKHVENDVRRRRSRNVVVLGLATEQQIAHATPGKVGLMARRAQGLQDVQRCFDLG